MSSNLQNSIWPNAGGTLGQIKVQIPDGVTTPWPEGDALVGNFVFNKGHLVGFVDTKALIANESKSTTFPYDYVNIHLDSILEGEMNVEGGAKPEYLIVTFGTGNSGSESFDFVIIDFNTTDQETIDTVRTAKRVVDNKLYDENDDLIGTWDTSKIEVGGIYDGEIGILDGLFCNIDMNNGSDRGLILSEFNSDLSSLRDGPSMFLGCTNLTSFNADLSSLTNGEYMFYACANLTSFEGDLSSLTSGITMFNYCNNLASFSSELHSLSNGMAMFYGCEKLTSFSSDLSNLTDGTWMFRNCYNLTAFNADLRSLKNGDYMFYNCKLDSLSVKNIIDTINNFLGELLIGIGCDNTETDENIFAQEVGYADMTSLLAALQAKRWIVNIQCNGRPTTTYGLRRPTEDTLPVFVKLEEVEKYADYTSLDETKKFRLNWFHETNGSTEGYTQYATLEEAIESLNIKPLEN